MVFDEMLMFAKIGQLGNDEAVIGKLDTVNVIGRNFCTDVGDPDDLPGLIVGQPRRPDDLGKIYKSDHIKK